MKNRRIDPPLKSQLDHCAIKYWQRLINMTICRVVAFVQNNILSCKVGLFALYLFIRGLTSDAGGTVYWKSENKIYLSYKYSAQSLYLLSESNWHRFFFVPWNIFKQVKFIDMNSDEILFVDIFRIFFSTIICYIIAGMITIVIYLFCIYIYWYILYIYN